MSSIHERLIKGCRSDPDMDICYMSYVPGQNDAGEVAKVNNSSQTP